MPKHLLSSYNSIVPDFKSTRTSLIGPIAADDQADADPAVTVPVREHLLSADYSGQIKVFRTHLQPAEGGSGGAAAAAAVSATIGAGGGGQVQKSPVWKSIFSILWMPPFLKFLKSII